MGAVERTQTSPNGTGRSFVLRRRKAEIRTLLRGGKRAPRRRLVSKPPPYSDFNLLRDHQCIVNIYAKTSHGTLDLSVPKQELDGAQIARSSVDHGRLCTTQGVRAVSQWIEPSRAKPGSQQMGALPHRHWLSPIDTAWKQRLALVQVLLLDQASHNLAGLPRNLELNRTACLPLHHGGARTHPPIESHIVGAERDSAVKDG
jgi:hypothetical protein